MSVEEVVRESLRRRAELVQSLDRWADVRDAESLPPLSAPTRSRLAAVAVAIAVLIPAGLLAFAALRPSAGESPGGPTPGGGGHTQESRTDAPIEVTSPALNANVSSPVVIEGTADVFEGNVRIRIFDAINNMIVDTFTTATCGSGCRGEFSAEIEFAVAEEQQGEIVVFEESAETGKPRNVVRIPVILVPGENLERAMEFIGTWTDGEGNAYTEAELSASLGPEHCSWGDIVFLSIAEPRYGSGPVTFVRDTTNELADHTERAWESLPLLLGDLTSDGTHVGDWELWFDPSNPRTVYLRHGVTGETEVWPALTQQIGCD